MKTGKLGSDEWEEFDKMDGTNLSNLPSSELRASEFTLTEVDEDDSKKEDDTQTEGKPPLPQGKQFKVPKTTSDGGKSNI